MRTSSASAAAEVARRDPTKAAAYSVQEIKRYRLGLKRDELSSSDVLDVTVFNLGNLARQTIQHQAEPRMLRLIMNHTAHTMMLVEGTSIAVHQWDKKLRDANWALCGSDDAHHWLGVRKEEEETQIKKLVDNRGIEHQKIWYSMFELKFGLTSTFKSVWGRQNVYRLMVGCSCQPCYRPICLPFLQNQLLRRLMRESTIQE